MRIKKVINNNILCAIDENGNELIVTGKGLGYKRTVGERVDPGQVVKTYRMEGKAEQRKLRELVERIPLEHLKLTEELIGEIRTKISQKLNESLLITLSDHISFAIQRKEQGIEFKNPLKGPIMCYYPTEYQMGQYCLQKIEEKLKVSLCEDEAAFIALHIVNAELNTDMSDMYEITNLLEGCVRVTEFYYRKKLDENSLDFHRYIVHLRYLIRRLFQNTSYADEMTEEDVMFRQLIKRNCRDHYECAQRIAAYIEANYGKKVSEEEKIYLTIHLKRLNMNGAQE